MAERISGCAVTAPLCLCAEFCGLLERNDGLHAILCNPEVDRELQVRRTEEIDEGVDAIGRCGFETFRQSVAIRDRGDTVSPKPLVIGL